MLPCPTETRPLHLFEGYGVELEYMIVDRTTLNIRSIADKVLAAVGGPWCREVECGKLAWSNELTLHVIELKTNGPATTLTGLHELFAQDIKRINELLVPHDACLMPTAMHPWIKPDEEAVLWQNEDVEIYTALDRIFGCLGHGWKNLQSAHLNLPFYDDQEFVQLHAAIRLVLPLIPAIAAASPIMDATCNGILDNRLMVYQGHCHRFPQAMGPVIPEPVSSIDQYHVDILQPIYQALKPYDPEGVLAYEWINARAAIARFDRNTIEIRLTDVQECPLADIAIVQLIRSVIQWLIDRNGLPGSDEQIPSDRLKAILQLTACDGQNAMIENADYLRILGMDKPAATGLQIWEHLYEKVRRFDLTHSDAVEKILDHGTLAWRMKQSLKTSDHAGRVDLYQQLADCLVNGKMLIP